MSLAHHGQQAGIPPVTIDQAKDPTTLGTEFSLKGKSRHDIS